MKRLTIWFSSWREETVNSASHGIGLLIAIIIFPFFWKQLPHRAGENTSLIIFFLAMVLVYLISTLYHALPEGTLKNFLLKLDYSVIFLFIAASYTAFAQYVSMGNQLTLIVIWSAAILGIILKVADRLTHPVHSAGYYLLFGWVTLIAAIGLATYLSSACIYWLVLGGICYSIGVIFYLIGSRLRFSHLGWHLLVMAGNGCHCIALLYRY